MLTIYNRNENTLTAVNSLTENNWIELISPTQEEMDQITKRFSLPSYFLKEAVDENVRPKIEEEGENKLLVLHIPYIDPSIESSAVEVKYNTIPFTIILAGSHFITVCKEKTDFNAKFFEQHKLMFGSNQFTKNTLSILHSAATQYIQLTEVIEQEIITAEDELSRSYRNPELYTLLHLNESLLFMSTSLKQMLHTMRKMDNDQTLEMHKDDKEIFNDTVVELEQAYAVTEINQLNSNNVMDAYGNIIQNNVSHVVKFLTAVTIVLSIPTLIASIYGMNVPLPYQEEPEAFTVIIVVMVVVSAIVAGIFYKKKYF